MLKKKDMKSGAILGYVSDTKKLVLFKTMSDLSNLIKEGSTEKLWDLSAEILTELSRRDGVDFRINATRDSVEKKVTKLNAPPKRNI